MKSCSDIAIFLASVFSFFIGLFYRKGCTCDLSDSDSVGRKRSSQLRRPKSLFWQLFVSRCDGGSDMLKHACWLFGEAFRRWAGDASRSRSVKLKPLSPMSCCMSCTIYRYTIIRWLCQLSFQIVSRYLLRYYNIMWIYPVETLQWGNSVQILY